MERTTGLEPVSPAWKAGALPLDDTRVAPVAGIEPAAGRFGDGCDPMTSPAQEVFGVTDGIRTRVNLLHRQAPSLAATTQPRPPYGIDGRRTGARRLHPSRSFSTNVPPP